MRILLVDDSSMVGRPLSLLLELAGYSVTWVTSGGEALLAVAHEGFDVIVCDVWLADIDGYSLMRVLSSRCEAPAIAMSAGPLPHELLVGSGFAGGYEKDGDVEPLLKLIRRALATDPARHLRRSVIRENRQRGGGTPLAVH